MAAWLNQVIVHVRRAGDPERFVNASGSPRGDVRLTLSADTASASTCAPVTLSIRVGLSLNCMPDKDGHVLAGVQTFLRSHHILFTIVASFLHERSRCEVDSARFPSCFRQWNPRLPRVPAQPRPPPRSCFSQRPALVCR